MLASHIGGAAALLLAGARAAAQTYTRNGWAGYWWIWVIVGILVLALIWGFGSARRGPPGGPVR